MKKNIRIVAVLLALVAALSVEASPVLERDAQYAAKGWGILNSKAFGALGDAEGVTAETDAAGNVQWYVVKMTKGAVVVAPDDEIEPVIAVLPNSNGVIPEGSSLRVMLEHDMANRLAGVSGAGGKLKLTTSSASSAAAPKETAKWNKLRQYGRGRVLKTSAVGEDPATIVRRLDGWNSDSKVNGVQTLRFWDQEDSEDYFTNPRVFNFYTPGHAPCGCVATAGSSVMHYFRVPSGNVLTRDCTYNGAGVELTTKGGTYDWTLIDSVNLKRGSTVTLSDAAVDLLGRVAYDCGVGCQMGYNDDGSGSTTRNLENSFREVFNVRNAQLVTRAGGDHGGGPTADIGPANYAKLIYNQIRGGAPVVLGIYMHEVVAVGYGYDDDKTDYTYVFTGWGGYNDAWYALPTIDTKATPEGGTYTSTFVDELITEIAPFDNKFIAVVGQVVDADGEPVPNDPVTMSNGEVVTTDENGFFGTRVSPTDPCYVIDSFGEEHEYELGNAAMRTTNSGLPSGTLAAALPEAMVVELLEPSVRVGGDDNRIYGSLTKALQCVMPRETVEILKPTIFKKSVTVPTSCTIFATNTISSETAVRHANDAIITVTNGVTVSISNVCFKTAAGEPVISAPQLFDVEAGGTLRLSRGCRMGPIKTARADGLVVANELTDSLYVTCAAAMGEGKAFAKYTTDYETAAKCAHFLRHPSNTRLGGAADKNGNIIWSRNAPVADDIAVAKTVIGGTSRNYLAMDDIIEDVATLTEPVEIVVIKDGALTRKYTLKSSSVTIRGEGEEKPVLTTATTAGFVIGSGTSLTLANVTFAGTKPANDTDEISFIKVDGGNLTLADGAELDGIFGRINGTKKYASGVIDLCAGVVTMEEGAVIANCSANGGANGKGGAIYVLCYPACTLNLNGGTITNCHSATYGGGVYLEHFQGYVPNVNVSGKLTVKGNSSQNFAADDIYLVSYLSLPAFKLTGQVEGEIGVRYSASATSGKVLDEAFITNAIGDGVDEATLYSFFNDAAAGMVAAKGTGDKAGKLVWAADTRDPRQCDEREAAAKLIASGRVTFWREVSDALNAATNNCIVEVLKEQTLANDVDIGGRVVLRTSGTELTRLSLVRAKDVSISIPDGSELSVTHVDFDGYNSDGVSCTPLFAVGGGVLKIEDVLIRDVTGGTNRNANAVTAFSGGTFEMRNSQISRCWNDAVDPSGAPEKTSDAGAGGGLLVDNATAYLRDSSIVNCRATWGGGAFACNGSTVYISGDVRIADNTANGAPSNLMASDTSSLVLAGALTGVARVSNLEYSLEHPDMTNVVATVSDAWKWTVTSLTNSAASFERDLDGAPAVAVTNGANALIVWCGAVKDGVYVNVEDGKPVAYALVGEMPVVLPALLPALTSESGVSGALARMSDARVGAKIATLGEYNKFRAWADGVDGGKASVAESDKAYVSYQFGTTSLLENDPTVEISEIENAEDGLRVSVIVKDGEDPVAVAAANVAKMFEATSDLGDWTKKVELAVTDPVPNGDGSVTFTVKPAGEPAAAFIRLAY